MPIYEYECLRCGITFEKRQSFSDEARANCPNGHEETRRLISAPAIVFKGSGFYINDSRAKNRANGSNSGTQKAGTGHKSEKSKSKSEKKTESKETA